MSAKDNLNPEFIPQSMNTGTGSFADPEVRTDNMELKAIAELAYRFWEERGRPAGTADEDWYRAVHAVKTLRDW